MKKIVIFAIIAISFSNCKTDETALANQKKNVFSYYENDRSGKTNKYGINNNVFAQLVANADEKKQFIANYSETAIEEQNEYRIPASITLSQAVLESDGGTSYNAVTFNNLFGVKCRKEKFLEVGCRINPDLIEQGEFAVYETIWASFRSHSMFLQRSIYAGIKDCQDYECWAWGLQKCGYGGDDNEYANKLISVIEHYELAKYDNNYPAKTANELVEKSVNKAPLKIETWILNNSHGDNTAGKRMTFKKALPNGEFTVFEYKLNREIVAKIVKRCNDLGLNYKVLVPELEDTKLKERAKRANEFEKRLGNTALITIDHNATNFNNSNEYSIANAFEDNVNKSVASGMESHVLKGSEMKQFTDALLVNIEKFLPNWHKRGVKESRFYTLWATSMPSCINYGDACFVTQSKNQDIIVEAIIYTMCQFSAQNIEYVGNGKQS
jgi:flagellum-specific peptidoglycan hydrolase FlgJ